MGAPQKADPTPAGDVKYIFRNSRGYEGLLQLQAGVTPILQLGTAGNGFRILSSAGAAILTLTETGVLTPAKLGVPTLLAEPTAGQPAQFYIFGGALKFWDGAAAYGVVLAP